MVVKIDKNKKIDYLFVIALIIAIASTLFWSLLLTHAYKTFEYGTNDLAYEAYNLYIDIHYTNLVHGLQFFALSNNLSPDVLLVLPIFYLHQSALTLVYLQIVVMGITSIIIFLVTKKLVKDSVIAIAFSTVFLLSPGVSGILGFDFHMEFLMIPFYILTFYYFMSSNKKMFAISLLLLLGVVEAAPLLSFTLGLGLFAYERSQSKGKGIAKDKKLMIIALLVASIIATILYVGAIKYLQSSYGTNYPQLPGILEMSRGNSAFLLSNISAAIGGPIKWLVSILSIYATPLRLFVLLVSLLIVSFGFGVFALYRPKITLILMLTWLFEVIFEGYTKTISFIYPGLYGYSYTLGSMFAAAILGAIFFVNKTKKRIPIERYLLALSTIIIALIVASISLLVSSAPLIFLINYHNPNPLSSYNATDISQLATLIPQNASLFTLNQISPHVAQRRYLEFPATESVTGNYFVPDYILIAYSNYTQLTTNNSLGGNVGYLLSNYSYTLYSKQGDARLYKLST